MPDTSTTPSATSTTPSATFSCADLLTPDALLSRADASEWSAQLTPLAGHLPGSGEHLIELLRRQRELRSLTVWRQVHADQVPEAHALMDDFHTLRRTHLACTAQASRHHHRRLLQHQGAALLLNTDPRSVLPALPVNLLAFIPGMPVALPLMLSAGVAWSLRAWTLRKLNAAERHTGVSLQA